MRGLLFTLSLLLSFAVSAQSLTNSTSSVIEQGNDRFEFIKVDDFGYALVKYEKYDDSGVLIQDGYYSNGKPAGVWRMYNPATQDVISTMKYDMHGNRLALSSEIDNRKTTVKYEEDKPSRVRTRFKIQE